MRGQRAGRPQQVIVTEHAIQRFRQRFPCRACGKSDEALARELGRLYRRARREGNTAFGEIRRRGRIRLVGRWDHREDRRQPRRIYIATVLPRRKGGGGS